MSRHLLRREGTIGGDFSAHFRVLIMGNVFRRYGRGIRGEMLFPQAVEKNKYVGVFSVPPRGAGFIISAEAPSGFLTNRKATGIANLEE